jgi:hypothetical protein
MSPNNDNPPDQSESTLSLGNLKLPEEGEISELRPHVMDAYLASIKRLDSVFRRLAD